MSVFLHPVLRERSNSILPGWFRVWFHRGMYVIGTANTLILATTIANLRADRGPMSAVARNWYWTGLGFTVAHFAFVPLVAYPVRDIFEDRSGGQSTNDLKRWIDVHTVRTLVTDLPGWFSYLCAVLSL